jgi:hypothetical protein
MKKSSNNKLSHLAQQLVAVGFASVVLSSAGVAANISLEGTQAQQLSQTLQQMGVQAAQDEHGGRVYLIKDITCNRQVTQNVQVECVVDEYTQNTSIQAQNQLAQNLYQQLQQAGAPEEALSEQSTQLGVSMLSCYQSLRLDQSQCQGQAHQQGQQ